MTSNAPRPTKDTAPLLAGAALIVLPLVGVALKMLSFGWLMLIAVAISPVLIIGYAMQIVIAATGFLGARGALRAASGRRRALAAAWLTSGGVVATGFLLVDGGDSDWGSTFMFLSGAQNNVTVGDISTVISFIVAVAWIAGWVWLLVEWIIALVRRKNKDIPLQLPRPAQHG